MTAMTDRLYLDHNATSPLRPACREAMLEAMDAPRNASSVHAEGRAAKQMLERARKAVADSISAPVQSVVFTSGGTESDHLGVLGMVHGGPKVRRIFVAATEHPAVPAAAKRTGVPVETVPVLTDGTLDLAWLDKRLSRYDVQEEGPFLLCAMLANNETGVIHPIAEAARIVRRAGGYTLVDAVQALYKVEIDFSTLGADMLALSAHKAGGPVGVGALVITPGLGIEPIQGGGGQEENRRAGTHNIAAIAGFGRLAEVASAAEYQALAVMRDRIEAGLPSCARAHGTEAPRLPNTSLITAPGFSSQTALMSLDLGGIAVSAGSACSSGKVRKSSVLGAMGVPEDETQTALRISLGWNTPKDAAERFLSVWAGEYERITSRAA
jgi:cysteine desulfurase